MIRTWDYPLTGVDIWGWGLQFDSHNMTRILFSTCDTSGFSFFASLVSDSGLLSDSVESDRERIFWEAARDRPERSETDPDGTNDGGFELGRKVPPKNFVKIFQTHLRVDL